MERNSGIISTMKKKGRPLIRGCPLIRTNSVGLIWSNSTENRCKLYTLNGDRTSAATKRSLQLLRPMRAHRQVGCDAGVDLLVAAPREFAPVPRDLRSETEITRNRIGKRLGKHRHLKRFPFCPPDTTKFLISIPESSFVFPVP